MLARSVSIVHGTNNVSCHGSTSSKRHPCSAGDRNLCILGRYRDYEGGPNAPPGERELIGASGWRYLVPYQEDLAAALGALRRQVFVDGDYISPAEEGYPEPASVEDLLLEEYGYFIETNGTHSILDVIEVVPAEDTDQLSGTIRPLTSAETQQLFGTTEPSHADYTRLADALLFHKVGLAERGTGRAVTLWEDGVPTEIAFWGYSGD